MGFGIKELVVILIIVILLFGTKKLKGIGTDLGGAIKGFKKSMAEDSDKSDQEEESPEQKTAESLEASETPEHNEKKDHTA